MVEGRAMCIQPLQGVAGAGTSQHASRSPRLQSRFRQFSKWVAMSTNIGRAAYSKNGEPRSGKPLPGTGSRHRQITAC